MQCVRAATCDASLHRSRTTRRMQSEAEELDADGIVGVQLNNFAHVWGHHATEFFAVGTAVRPLRDDHVVEPPSMVVSLT